MTTAEQTAMLAGSGAFRHEALLYSGHDGFLIEGEAVGKIIERALED